MEDLEKYTYEVVKSLSVKRALSAILLVSMAAFLFLIWLIYFRDAAERAQDWVYQLPALNAFLNSVSAFFIIIGYVAIRRRQIGRHMSRMLCAFVASTLFLVSYLLYHSFVGHTPFPGDGLIRPLYFTLLISHIILSAFVVPLVLTSFYFAWSGRIRTHRKVSKWTLPIWLYVSVTGVLIFFVLNHYL